MELNRIDSYYSNEIENKGKAPNSNTLCNSLLRSRLINRLIKFMMSVRSSILNGTVIQRIVLKRNTELVSSLSRS